ncbi:hypothetical protein TrVFT333_000702 [Trichoderma virens FT-333]|nr:hypothetical protein TrVFT333_000702 [Trichoderma virens FT-333]
MATDQSNPGDFISLLSSEDETPLAKKRKSPDDDSASIGGIDASTERSKRARVSSASADSITGAKVSEEGEIDDDEDSEGEQREGTWLARFKEWAQLLCTANSPSVTKITPALVRAAYKQYIDIHSRLKPNKKRAARQAAEQYEDASLADLIKSLQPRQTDAAQLPAAAEEALTGPKAQTDAPSQLPAAQVSPQVSPQGETPAAAVLLPPIPVLTTQTDDIFVIDVKPQPPQTANTREPRPVSQPVSQPTSQPVPQPPAKATMSQRPGLPSGDEALEQQRRYFPSASDPSNMCLLCGREGHTADGCTNCACKFCGQDDHWQYACPSLDLRCDKCDIRGHSTAGCVTSIPRDYHFKCSFCHTANRHEDEHCTEPWRSFHPETETIKMVTALPVSCASCGSNHHFSANCNMDRVSDDPPNPTWSLYNMGRYIDATSSSSAIIGADECAPSQQSGELKIRGHASRTNEVRYYSDSDDSDDVQFLGRRVAPKPVRTGRIKVSASLQPPNGDQQPPLPLAHLLLSHHRRRRRPPIAHQDTATHKRWLGQTRSPPDHRFLRGTIAAYHRLPPNPHKDLASSLAEEVEGAVVVAVEVVAEGEGEEIREEVEAIEEESLEAARVEVVKRLIMMEFGYCAGKEMLRDDEWSKHAPDDLIHAPLHSGLQCQGKTL